MKQWQSRQFFRCATCHRGRFLLKVQIFWIVSIHVQLGDMLLANDERVLVFWQVHRFAVSRTVKSVITEITITLLYSPTFKIVNYFGVNIFWSYLRGAMIQSHPIVSKSTTNGCRQHRFLFLNDSSQSRPTFRLILFLWFGWLTSISKYGTYFIRDVYILHNILRKKSWIFVN